MYLKHILQDFSPVKKKKKFHTLYFSLHVQEHNHPHVLCVRAIEAIHRVVHVIFLKKRQRVKQQLWDTFWVTRYTRGGCSGSVL